MAEEGGVWSKLPEEVMESIFNRLSVYDVVRAGCTCRRLRAFISSHRLIPPSSASFLLLDYSFASGSQSVQEMTQQDLSAWAYDYARDSWLKLSLPFLQRSLPDFAYPVASAGGLVCFGSGRNFVICNPITRSCRRLPTIPLRAHTESGQSVQVDFDEQCLGQCLQAFGLSCNSITGTYEFFIIYRGTFQYEKECRIMCYSSLPSQWRVLPPLVNSEPCDLYSNTITPCKSGLYTLWQRRNSFVVFAYCNGVWNEIKGPDCTSVVAQAALLDVHGSLHMVGSFWLPGGMWGSPPNVRIWKLHGNGIEWIEVTRLRSSHVIDFREQQWWGKNGVLYMKEGVGSEVLTFDFDRNKWKWLKDLQVDVDLVGINFEPSLSACV